MFQEKIKNELREYIKDHYIPERISAVSDMSSVFACAIAPACESSNVKGILGTAGLFGKSKISPFRDEAEEVSEYIKAHKNSGDFAHTLERMREQKELSAAELYKSACVDRRQYSRLLGPEGRHPSMKTAMSFALALKLDRAEFDELLQAAGYALRCSSTRDVCIMFCVEKGIYDIEEVDALLFELGCEPLVRE
jgi:hypothetical protein